MGRKRKASRNEDTLLPRKKPKTKSSPLASAPSCRSNSRPILLSQFYRDVFTLREYFASNFPASHPRRRRILSFQSTKPLLQAENEQDNLLDNIIVGATGEQPQEAQAAREKDFIAFSHSQQRSTSSTSSTQCCNMQDVGLFSSLACTTCVCHCQGSSFVDYYTGYRLRHMVALPIIFKTTPAFVVSWF